MIEHVKEVAEAWGVEEANRMLANGHWILLDARAGVVVADGRTESVFLLGRIE